MTIADTALPPGLAWDAERGRLRVLTPALADLALRDPHIITGVDRSSPDMAKLVPAEDEAPSITGFFELWYTVNDDYQRFNTELRKVFTPRSAASYGGVFAELADRYLAAMPAEGDLAKHYLAPYLMNSTFAVVGVPESDWPNMTKVALLITHLFKQQLLGVTEHGAAERRAFETIMLYLKSLTDRLLEGDGDAPFLTAARELASGKRTTWPIAALIGQLLMAGIEPMIVGSAVAARDIWSDPALLAGLRDGSVDAGEVAEELMRRQPPFGYLFRFVSDPCDCFGVPLAPGTLIAIDIAAVNLAHTPAQSPVRGCPVRPSAVLTFGKGAHYCLGASSARLQVATGIHALVRRTPPVHIDPAAVRVDTSNNLKELRAVPYTTRPTTNGAGLP
ncbi:cytochrome P450 [Actinokineospora soli]|uniref:Cytochrome P450 n=1 Tax=Actinokineospora soli TaxID=1048753 RepID=A0ABW2TM69_9PSEU